MLRFFNNVSDALSDCYQVTSSEADNFLSFIRNNPELSTLSFVSQVPLDQEQIITSAFTSITPCFQLSVPLQTLFLMQTFFLLDAVNEPFEEEATQSLRPGVQSLHRD